MLGLSIAGSNAVAEEPLAPSDPDSCSLLPVLSEKTAKELYPALEGVNLPCFDCLISDSIQSHFDRYIALNPESSLKSSNSDYYIEINGSNWQITQKLWDKSRYLFGATPSLREAEFNLVSIEDRHCNFTVTSQELFEISFVGIKALRTNDLELQAERARKHRLSEIADPAEIRNIDLKDTAVYFIDLHDTSARETFFRKSARNFAVSLRQEQTPGLVSNNSAALAYGTRALSQEDRAKLKKNRGILSSAEDYGVHPARTLEEEIDAAEKAGVSTVIIDFNAHGIISSVTPEANGIYFTDPWSSKFRYLLTADDLTSKLNNHPELNFIVKISSCYGGGISEPLIDFKDESSRAGRVVFIIESGEHQENYYPAVRNSAKPGQFSDREGSYFQIFLNDYLRQGLSLGAALLEAADAAELYMPNSDCLFIKSMPDGKNLVTR